MWQLNSKKEGLSIDRLVRCFDVFLRRRSQVSAHAAPDDAAEPASVAATNAAPFTNTHSVADSLSVVPAIAAAEPPAITAANCAPVGDPDTAADALTYKRAFAAPVASSNQHAFTTSLALAHGITDNAAIAASHAFSNVRGGFAALVAFVGLLLRLVWGGALIAALAGPIFRAEGLAPFIRAERARIFLAYRADIMVMIAM